MKSEYRKVSDLFNWKDNPRGIKKDKFEELKNRIKEEGQIKPLIVTPEGEVLGGNMRLRAFRELGIDEAWVSIVKPKNEAHKIKLALTDNEEMGYYEDQALAELIDKYKDEIDLTKYKVHLEQTKSLDEILKEFSSDELLSDEYSQKLGEVIYEPRETDHKVSDLYTKETKFDQDIEKIKNPKLKELFKLRTAYFSNFDFPKIADYYAYQATPEEQRIMEKLALVLLDKNQLIELGFSKIISDLDNE